MISEKLKIKPVNINDLQKGPDLPFIYSYLDPKSIKLTQLSNCDIVRTDKVEAYNIWMYFDLEYMLNISPKYGYLSGAFLRYDTSTTSNVSYINIETFVHTWPKHRLYKEYNINALWRTNIDPHMFKDEKTFINFFKTNNLLEYFNNINI